MNLLARSTDYAVRSLIYMASDPDQVTSTVELGNNLGLPRPFLRRILLVLQKAGYLGSVKGNKGGFTLIKAPKKIFLHELMRLFQGEISLGDCLFRKKICTCASSCPLRREIKQMEKILLGRLTKITLADLLKGQR